MNDPDEKLTERRVTYTIEHEGKFYIVENLPARVNEETGQQFFSLCYSRGFAENHNG